MSALHAVIHGRVQGVGFRYYVLRRARARALRGWVRNLTDGTVEVWAEGPEAALVALLVELEEGPVGSRVVRVDADRPAASQKFDDFAVR